MIERLLLSLILMVTIFSFIGFNIDDEAMDICQEKYTYNTCVKLLN